MINDRDTVAMANRAHKSEAPDTVATVSGAKSNNQTEQILQHTSQAWHAVCAILLHPALHAAVATACAAALVLLGGHHGF